jgi:hypothetical protein
MATILKARGRMTKDLVTPHHAGDQVVALIREDQRYGRVEVGDVGMIRWIFISDANDGDETFLLFYVKVPHGTVLLHPTEFAPVAEAGAHLWARRQIDALGARL